jgi:Protein of unknown function (DUF4231)
VSTHSSTDGSPVWAWLEDQIAWYDGKAQHNQRRFKQLKVCQIVLAAAIPVAAAASAPTWLLGGGGGLIVILEGIQQLQQYQQTWTSYRTTCERLRYEKLLCEARGGPYAVASDTTALLAERVQAVVSKEHAEWVKYREEASRRTETEG